MAHTDEEYRSFDFWIADKIKLQGSIDDLKKNPNSAKNEILQKVEELFNAQFATVGNYANSIKKMKKIYDDESLTSDQKNSQGIAKIIDEVIDWKSHVGIGEEWNESVKMWVHHGIGGASDEINREERILKTILGDPDQATEETRTTIISDIKRYGEDAVPIHTGGNTSKIRWQPKGATGISRDISPAAREFLEEEKGKDYLSKATAEEIEVYERKARRFGLTQRFRVLTPEAKALLRQTYGKDYILKVNNKILDAINKRKK